MRIPACIWLCPEDRTRLERLVADRNTSRKVVWRSRIALLSAQGHGTMEIMRRTGTSKPTVWRWQERYLEAGVDGLLRDKSRPPGKPPLDPAIKTLVLTKTMRETPLHYDELKTLGDDLKGRMWLYDYQDGEKPDCKADGFLGWVQQGQVFDFKDPESFRMVRLR